MIIGYRITQPEELGAWEADFVQITVFQGAEGNLPTAERCVSLCRDMEVSFVMHPVNYTVLGSNPMQLAEVRELALKADLALILHDERAPGGGRLSGEQAGVLRGVIKELSEICPVSFENSLNTADAPWFWSNFAESVTLDIGHVDAAGLNSIEYVESLSPEIIRKICFVHIHKNGPLRYGLTDHHPLTPECREVQALRALLKRKSSVGVILELIETDGIGESLQILRDLRDETGAL
jgi:hypothetical protein